MSAPRAGACTPVDDVRGLTFGWISPTPGFMQRASHAVLSRGAVWYVDPVLDDAMLAHAAELGPAAGVVQLVDRHARDGVAVAQRLGVPLHVLPAAAPEGSPFQVIPVVAARRPRWHEIALWFADDGVLCVGEAVGGAPYFRARGERIGPHPLLRIARPPLALCGLPARHVLCGHGEGLHANDAGLQMERAIRNARRRLPSWGAGLVGQVRRTPPARAG